MGIPGRIVDAIDEDVLEGDPLPGREGEPPADFEDPLHGMAFVNGHEKASSGIVCGVEGDGELKAEPRCHQSLHSWNEARCRKGNSPSRETEAQVVLHHFNGRNRAIIVGQGFPHSHKDNIG